MSFEELPEDFREELTRIHLEYLQECKDISTHIPVFGVDAVWPPCLPLDPPQDDE